MSYQIEIFTNCYGPFGLVAALDGTEKLGMKEIELSVETHPGVLDIPQKMEDLDKWDPSQVDRLKTLLSKYGLTAESGFIFVENTDKEAFALDKIKFDVAQALGLKVINLSVTWNKPLEEAYKIFPSVLEYCEQYDFELALELHPPLYDNAEVFWKVAKDFPGFPLKANFDTANVYYYNQDPDGPAELEKVFERLAHMHIKDSMCKYHDFTFPALGEGTVPFDKYFEVCKKHKFTGPISLEIEGHDEEQKSFAGKQDVMVRSVKYLKGLGVL
ncbi:MAG: sugar phosphate isomerase/epimerase [Candidatus Omnitrophica bacterium]|nr:sugar phosphate isomerase/epimerase [Candidatus Omnitrophota bacterium]MCA9440288.1 sugar phosphate isomerase/epimerase [Candidatus Omnitrophota bacterium]